MTDSAGKTVICAPAQQQITLRLSYFGTGSGARNVVLTTQRPTVHLSTLALPIVQVRGTVIDQQTAQPLANVSIRLAPTRLQARTTSDGKFLFPLVPLGDYELRIEHLSYQANGVSLQVRTEDLEATVPLTAAAIPLAPITVTAFSVRLERMGFYERRKRGIGTFIDRREIDAMHAQSTADLLRNVPGLRLLTQMPRRAAPRVTTLNRSSCRFRFVVDGTRVMADYEMENIPPFAIEGLEVYRGLAEVPALFRALTTSDPGTATCGVIVVWTRDSR